MKKNKQMQSQKPTGEGVVISLKNGEPSFVKLAKEGEGLKSEWEGGKRVYAVRVSWYACGRKKTGEADNKVEREGFFFVV